MAGTDFSQLEAALSAAGWRFDPQRERFSDGSRRISYRRVLELLPGLTLGELASYVTEKHEEWLLKKRPGE
ncbi:MAG TPA: hypothetical protein VGI40_18005 [Pirellulaceae bacterium]|jgi:hypothetical protein